MAWALSMGMIRSRQSEFGRASSGPTSLRHRATGSKRIRQTRARPGRQTGCRTSHEFANRGDRQIGKMAQYLNPTASATTGVHSMTARSFTLARLRRRRKAFLNPHLPERCLAGDGPGRLIAVEVEA